jgi:hypothetical protein
MKNIAADRGFLFFDYGIINRLYVMNAAEGRRIEEVFKWDIWRGKSRW